MLSFVRRIKALVRARNATHIATQNADVIKTAEYL